MTDNEYMRKWRERNKERYRAYQREYHRAYYNEGRIRVRKSKYAA